MKIALVILNWNGKELLKKFLPTLIANSKQADIYIIDNNSEDDSVVYINNTFEDVTVIKNTNNDGFAKGYNLGLSKINADVFALINSDIEVTPNWLLPIINFYKKNTNASIVQPKILDYNNKNTFEYAGAAGGFIDKYGYAFCRGRIFNSLEEDTNQYQSSPIFWATGACLFIKSDDFKDLKGFDEDYFAHYEEIDLCWRAKNKGLLVNCVTDSKVYHVGGATLDKSNPYKSYLNFRNSLFTLLKNLPKNKLIPVLFIRMVLDGIAGIQFLVTGKPKHFISILKAHFSFYKQLSHMYKKRGQKQLKNYYHQKSIVWSYYINKQRTFKI